MKYNFDDVTSETICYVIDNYVHNSTYRKIAKDRLLDNMSFGELEKKYGYSDRHLKRIVYRISEIIFKKIA